MPGVLVDAGRLVALIDRADPDHEACVASLKTLRGSLITVWPAFTEATYLLRGSWPGQKAIWSRWRPTRSRWPRSAKPMRLACAS